MQSYQTKVPIYLLIPILGIFGLYLSEAGHALAQVAENGGPVDIHLPPFAMIQGILFFSLAPLLLLSVKWSAAVRWLTLSLIALLTLFHLAHIVEHGMAGDIMGVSWIILFCVLPNIMALVTTFKHTKINV